MLGNRAERGERETERQSEKGLDRERDNDAGERKWHGLEGEDGVGLNQHLSIFRDVDQ
jgi:hypothetical protein